MHPTLDARTRACLHLLYNAETMAGFAPYDTALALRGPPPPARLESHLCRRKLRQHLHEVSRDMLGATCRFRGAFCGRCLRCVFRINFFLCRGCSAVPVFWLRAPSWQKDGRWALLGGRGRP